MFSDVLVAIVYSHERNELRPSKRPRPRHARSRTSCSAQGLTAGEAAYTALELGGGLGGGIVQCPARSAVWLPYVQVPDVAEATRRARALGASLLLAPREGPAGWRSVVAAPGGGELA